MLTNESILNKQTLKIEEFVGKTITKVFYLDYKEEIIFVFSDETFSRLKHTNDGYFDSMYIIKPELIVELDALKETGLFELSEIEEREEFERNLKKEVSEKHERKEFDRLFKKYGHTPLTDWIGKDNIE